MIDAMSGKPPAFPKRQWVLKAEWLIIEISLKSSLSSRKFHQHLHASAWALPIRA
jgi:hypothetical protein